MEGKYVVFGGVRTNLAMSQIDRLITELRQEKTSVVQTREPGGTPLAEQVRVLLQNGLHGGDRGVIRKLIAAARIDHEHKVVHPALERGGHVFCDSTGYTQFLEFDVGHEPSLVHEGFTREYLRGRPTMLIVFVAHFNDERQRLVLRNLDSTVNAGSFGRTTVVEYVDPDDTQDVERVMLLLKEQLNLETV